MRIEKLAKKPALLAGSIPIGKTFSHNESIFMRVNSSFSRLNWQDLDEAYILSVDLGSGGLARFPRQSPVNAFNSYIKECSDESA